jgi:pimeloyl-ACP methyl ester carboxylesterase
LSIAEGHWLGTATYVGKSVGIELFVSESLYETPALMSWPELGQTNIPCAIDLVGSEVTVKLFSPRQMTMELKASLEADALVGTIKCNWYGALINASVRLERTGPARTLYVEEDVSFASVDAELAGTMIYPASPGPHPTIVWIHGSGGVGRRRSDYVNLPYLLADRGFASLVYDKRGVDESTGDWRTADFFDLANDALAGIEHIGGLATVDERSIGLCATSQGGWVAPIVAVRSKDVAAIATISASGVSSAEQTIYFIEGQLRLAGATPEEIAHASSLQRRVHDFVRTGSGHDALQADLDAVRQDKWFTVSYLPEVLADEPDLISILDFDSLPWWRQVQAPVLALWGAADTIVPPHRSRDTISRALAEANNLSTTCITFDNARHALHRDRDPGDTWDWRRLHPDYVRTMTTWFKKHLACPRE